MKNPESSRHWLGKKFLVIFPRLFVALYLLAWAYWGLYRSLYGSGTGTPFGADYSYCWAAASLALGGDPTAVYDFSRIREVVLALFGINLLVPWPYPPTYLLLLLPFALLPYLASLSVWLSATMLGYLCIIRRIAPHPQVLWFALAFPVTFQNLYYGQNGFLSAFLLGGGLLLLDRSPWAAGLLLALLTYKPHLAVLVPVALVAGRRWQALLAMLAWTAALVLATTLAWGPQIWVSFVNHLPQAMKILESGGLNVPYMMPTVFAAVLLSGAGMVSARILQAASMLVAAALVGWAWRRDAAPAIRNSVLVLGILLFIPHGYVYDLALLALPLAWLGWEGFTRGWLPGEITCLVLAWFSPLILPLLALKTNVQIFPLMLMTLMFLVLRRALRESSPAAGKPAIQGQIAGDVYQDLSPSPPL